MFRLCMSRPKVRVLHVCMSQVVHTVCKAPFYTADMWDQPAGAGHDLPIRAFRYVHMWAGLQVAYLDS